MKINLVPEVKQEQQKVRKVNLIVTTTAIVVAVAAGATAIILLLYVLGKTAQLNSVNKNITKVEEELVKYKDLEKTVVSLETGLREIKQVIDGKQKWTLFFPEIEKATPSDIQIKNLDVKDGKVTMSLQGQNVKSIDRFIKSFSNFKYKDKNLFSDVKVSGYSTSGDKVDFQAEMTMVQGVLW